MKPESNSVAAETVQTTNIPAVDVPRLVRLLRGRDYHYNAGELMTMAADALESLIRDKERMDWLETQDCWIGICGDYYAEAVNSCGGCYVKKVREVCDECLANSQAMARDASA